MAKPEGRLFFAGEHADYPHAWMDSSIKSGIRAAAEVHLQKDYSLVRGVVYNKNTQSKGGKKRPPVAKTQYPKAKGK